jgi:hypothetical protein
MYLEPKAAPWPQPRPTPTPQPPPAVQRGGGVSGRHRQVEPARAWQQPLELPPEAAEHGPGSSGACQEGPPAPRPAKPMPPPAAGGGRQQHQLQQLAPQLLPRVRGVADTHRRSPSRCRSRSHRPPLHGAGMHPGERGAPSRGAPWHRLLGVAPQRAQFEAVTLTKAGAWPQEPAATHRGARARWGAEPRRWALQWRVMLCKGRSRFAASWREARERELGSRSAREVAALALGGERAR